MDTPKVDIRYFIITITDTNLRIDTICYVLCWGVVHVFNTSISLFGSYLFTYINEEVKKWDWEISRVKQ